MAVTAQEFFDDDPFGFELFEAIAERIELLGEVEVRVSTSQVAFRRQRGFAYVWRPGRYVRSDVPAVLSVALPREVPSPRWKEVAHPAPEVWMHHLEVRAVTDIDAEVDAWLREAYDAAG
ncbi:MAG: DUF5655 domain-containing protein [Microbacteriaceae bacterium]